MRDLHLVLALIAALVLSGGCICRAEKVTVDPNAGAISKPAEDEVVDPRLGKKVTYVAWHTPVRVVLADISQLTGVTLNAGYAKSDWQVRDRRMNIRVEDVTLGELMNSIARVMKFKWSRSEAVQPPHYRLVSDRRLLGKMQAEATRREKALKQEVTTRRAALVRALAEAAKASDSELKALRTENPYLYACAVSGFAKMITQMWKEQPKLQDHFIKAEKFAILYGWEFSESTHKLCADVLRKLTTYSPPRGPLVDDVEGDFAKETMHFDTIPTPSEHSVRRQLHHFGSLNAVLAGNGDNFAGVLKDPNSESAQVWAEGFLEAFGQGAMSDESRQRRGKRDWESDLKDARESEHYLMTDDPVEHPDEPYLHEKLSPEISKEDREAMDEQLKTAGPRASSRLLYEAALKAIGRAAKANIVSDSYMVMLTYDQPQLAEGEFGTVLDKFSDPYRVNWEKHGSILEFRRMDWFRRRSSQIPDEWLVPWRDELNKNGILSLNSYARIASLTEEQSEENIKPDPLLSRGMGEGWRWLFTRGFSCFYAQLNDNQRGQIFSKEGMNLHMLTPGQWPYYSDIFLRGWYPFIRTEMLADPGNKPVVMKGTSKVAEDGGMSYWISVTMTQEDGTDFTDGWAVAIPRISPPANKQDG